MDDDLVAGADVRYLIADREHDARAVAAAGMEIFGLSLSLPVGDDVDGYAERRPDIVVVDPGCHDVDQHVERTDLGGVDDFALPGVPGLAEAILAHEECVHLLRYLAQRRTIAEIT